MNMPNLIGDLMSNNLPKRKNIRLKDHDYSSAGYYFITICTHEKRSLLGSVGVDSISARMTLNNAGKMVSDTLAKVFDSFENATLDKYVIMPNHIHMIIILSYSNEKGSSRADMESAPTVADIVQSFKRYSTIKYIAGVKTGIYPSFDRHIWQRSYHDHVIRNEQTYQNIWQYIDNNPATWKDDRYYTQ